MATITLSLMTQDTDGRLVTRRVGGEYRTRRQAMVAAEKYAGEGAEYTGVAGNCIRYTGEARTVYLVE